MGKWPNRHQPPSDVDELEDLTHIPTKGRGPEILPSWTIAPIDGGGDFYRKAPRLEEYLDSNLEARIQHEIDMCELIRQNPHPNLAVYHGCVCAQGKVTGLVFKSYKETLSAKVNPQHLSTGHFVASNRRLVQPSMKGWLEKLQSAIHHLNSLGLVHNDITPANVMLDESEEPVLIDFGSVCREGDSLEYSGRTHEWHDPTVSHARKQNDLDALEELEAWLYGIFDKLKFAASKITK